MATRVKYCMRCFTQTKATITGKFSYENHDYEVELCDQHGAMFDRDMLAWTRIGREVEKTRHGSVTSFTPAVSATNIKVPFPVTDGGVEVSDDRLPPPVQGEMSAEAMTYEFTEPALLRMKRRRITRVDVLRLLSSKQKYTRPGIDFSTLVHELGDMRVVVDPVEKSVLTVAFKGEPEEALT